MSNLDAATYDADELSTDDEYVRLARLRTAGPWVALATPFRLFLR